ncbi:hypothetical protein FNV43_RR10514 [Rhamnella rubrinervis]|uniref:Uncharacterized protein n=1 Tax=Rhamnella rubrinervis TaxID=2594499 RepID=A0A8K0H476_9ROSA|nr:hypothetical protein FNV43_RR10514 [Rhamnella rubrinervis]
MTERQIEVPLLGSTNTDVKERVTERGDFGNYMVAMAQRASGLIENWGKQVAEYVSIDTTKPVHFPQTTPPSPTTTTTTSTITDIAPRSHVPVHPSNVSATGYDSLTWPTAPQPSHGDPGPSTNPQPPIGDTTLPQPSHGDPEPPINPQPPLSMGMGWFRNAASVEDAQDFKWFQKKKHDADADYWRRFAYKALELILIFFFWLHLEGCVFHYLDTIPSPPPSQCDSCAIWLTRYGEIHPVNLIEMVFTGTFVAANFVIVGYLSAMLAVLIEKQTLSTCGGLSESSVAEKKKTDTTEFEEARLGYMSSSSGTSNLRYRKTVLSTGSNNVLDSNNVGSPGSGFLGGRSLPPCRSKKINDNAKETQFSVCSLIPHETRSAPSLQQPQLHDSKQIELTSIHKFRPLHQPLPEALIFPPGDGSQALLAYQRGTSEMPRSNVFDWNRLVKRFEHLLMTLKELQATDNAILELLDRKDASDRRFKEFLDSHESESPVKVRESLAVFKKEEEDMKQCMSELLEVEEFNFTTSVHVEF